MAHTSGYETLHNIVMTAIDMAEEDVSKYNKFLKLGIACYRNLRLHHVSEGEMVSKLSVDSTLNTVDFPDDMVDWIAIGVPVDGKLWTLTRKHGVIKTTTTEDATETYDTSIGEGQDLINDVDSGYNARGGVNDEGYFDIDYPNKRFVLKNTTATTVWLAYVTSGINLEETDQYLPIKYEETIRAYIIWQANVYRSDVALNFKRELERQYEQQLKDLRHSEIHLGELMDTLYALYHMEVRNGI